MSHAGDHLALPIRLAADGTFAALREDSPEEIRQNVAQVLRTRFAERLATPDFGSPDPTFVGFDAEGALALAGQWEPRASLALVEQVLNADGTEVTTINVQRREG